MFERNAQGKWDKKIEIDLQNPNNFGSFVGSINHNHTKVMTHYEGDWQEFAIDVDGNSTTLIDNGTLGEEIFGMQYTADDGKIFIYR